jgi:eukaryotic-like serine/threonine-protein kinase
MARHRKLWHTETIREALSSVFSRFRFDTSRSSSFATELRSCHEAQSVPEESIAVSLLRTRVRREFQVQARLDGGMGVVFLCFDSQKFGFLHGYSAPEWSRAFKSLQPRALYQREALQQFLEEARLWSLLGTHPNIVRLEDVHHCGEWVFLEMERVEGGDLSLLTRRGPMPLEQTIAIGRQVCTGMLYANTGHKLVHCDLKPSNILLANEAKISDFGIALLQSPDSVSVHLDSVGVSRAGTVAYMAPEQWLGSALDCRTDIYAFGLIVYEMLAGRHPFASANSVEEFRESHINVLPDSVRHWRRDVPKWLDELIVSCLGKDRRERPTDWEEVLECLGQTIPRSSAPASKGADSKESIHESQNLRSIGRLAEALDLARRAIDLNPSDERSWLEYGHCLQMLGRCDEAIVAYDRIVERGRQDHLVGHEIFIAHVWTNRANCSDRLGRDSEAERCYEEALSLLKGSSTSIDSIERWRDSTCANCLMNYGAFHGGRRRHNRALVLYLEACQYDLEGSDSTLHFNMAISYGALGRLEEALSSADRAVKIESRSMENWAMRAAILNLMGHSKEAERCILQGAQLSNHRSALEDQMMKYMKVLTRS